MNDFTDRPEVCPSELELDQLSLEELDPQRATALRDHIESCAHCQPLMAEREAGFDAYPAFAANRDALVARIEHAHRQEAALTASPPAPAGPVTRLLAWMSGPRGMGALLAAAAVVTLVVMAPRDPTPGDGLRIKGGVKLRVFVARQGGSEEVLRDDTLAAGDRLRFSAGVPRTGSLMVVGVEASGQVFAYHPLDGMAATATTAVTAPDDLLDASVALDDSRGRESIHLVWCPGRFELQDLVEAGRLRVPADCRSDSLAVNKR